MKHTSRFTGVALVLVGALAMCGCNQNHVGADGFPPPQPEPQAAVAAAQAGYAHSVGAPPKPPANAVRQANPQ